MIADQKQMQKLSPQITQICTDYDTYRRTCGWWPRGQNSIRRSRRPPQILTIRMRAILLICANLC